MPQIFFEGLEAALAKITELVVKQNAATRTATAKALHVVEREIKTNLSRGSHRKGEPTGSLPGEPPDLVTGNLRRSITVTGPDPVGAVSWAGKVGPTAVYGRIQELGGVTGAHGSHLPARPYVEPALDRVQPEIARIFYEAWASAIEL